MEYKNYINPKINLDGIIPQYSKKHTLKDLENGVRKQ